MRARSLAVVKFLSRLLAALNLLPSMATRASESSPMLRQSRTKRRQVAWMAGPLSRRKSAIVLKSGARRPSSHINSRFRCASRSRRRLEGMRFRLAVDIELQQRGWVVGRAPSLRRNGPLEAELGQVQPVDERFDDPNGVVLVDVVVNALRQQESLTPIQAFDVTRHGRESVAAPLLRFAHFQGRGHSSPMGFSSGVVAVFRADA